MESDWGPGPGSPRYQMGVAVGLLPTTGPRGKAPEVAAVRPRVWAASACHTLRATHGQCAPGAVLGTPHPPTPRALVCWLHTPNPWDTGICSSKPSHICVAASMLWLLPSPGDPGVPCLVRLRPACLLNSRADCPVGWGGGSLTSSRLSGPPLSEPQFPLL